MTLSDLSIKRPVFAWMLMIALIVFGGLAFQRLGISQLPDVDFPVVNISVVLEGASPEVMEIDVVDVIEGALTAVQGIKSMSSSSKVGSASVSVEFDISKNIDVAVSEIQTVVARVLRKLPKNMDPPVISKSNPEDQPILWIALSSKTMPVKDLMTLVRDQVKDRFTTVQGVGEVQLGGYVEPNLRIWLSRKDLDRYDLTANDIINTIQTEHTEVPSGKIETTVREYDVRTLGEAPSLDEFGQLTISRRGGSPNFQPIPLQKVARIEDGLEEVRRKSSTNGFPAVGLGIKKQRGSNAVEVAHAAKAKLAEIKKGLPPEVEMAVRFDATQFIEESINELNFTLILSALLTAIVCWMFLGSFTATINVVLAIPTSIIGSFIILAMLGFTLNTFTLLGLSLAIGIVVDDAIMVLENIVRHREHGLSRMDAASVGAREITFAALAATAAIIAIFLPVAFMRGIIGRFFFQFGVTLSVAVALSLLEALTLTPMRCSQFLYVGERKTILGRFIEGSFEKSAAFYKRAIAIFLRFRWLTLMAAVAFFAGSYYVVNLLNKEFVPPQDQSRLMVRFVTPVGSSLAIADAKLKEIEAILKVQPETAEYFSTIGGFSGGEVNSGFIFVTLKPLQERGVRPDAKKPLSQQDFAQVLRKTLKSAKDTKIVIQDPSLSGFTAKRGFPVEFTVRGPDWETLISSAQDMMDKMRDTGLMTDVDSDYQAGLPQFSVVPDRTRAAQFGVSIADIGQIINALIGGVVVAKYSKGGHRYDVRMRLVEEERNSAEDILKLNVRNNRGVLIPLKEVVKIEEHKALQAISRQDRERGISVFANIAPGASQAKAIDTVNALARETMPAGYRIVISGSAETFKESFQSLIFALLLGLIVSYMVLASQFNSFIHPITVLMALPFSVSGAFIALYFAHQSLSIYSMIGLILLMGIVKKNSILLVDYTNQCRREGLSVTDALIKACPVRLRPILMTSFATLAAALPAALALGPGAESRIPMAVTVIGGVTVSTFLTLFIVPCVYSLFANLERQKYAE